MDCVLCCVHVGDLGISDVLCVYLYWNLAGMRESNTGAAGSTHPVY